MYDIALKKGFAMRLYATDLCFIACIFAFCAHFFFVFNSDGEDEIVGGLLLHSEYNESKNIYLKEY